MIGARAIAGFLLGFGLFSTGAWAATYPQKAGPYGPGITVNDYASHNARRLVPVEFRTGAPLARYTPATVGASAASVARIAKKAMGGPWGIALTAAVVGAGYLFDEESGEVIVPGDHGDGPYTYTIHDAYGALYGSGSGYNNYRPSEPYACEGPTVEAVQACGVASFPSSVTYMGNVWDLHPNGPSIQPPNKFQATYCRSCNGYDNKTVGWTVRARETVTDSSTPPPWPADSTPATDEQVANAVEQAGLTPQAINYYFTSNEFNIDRTLPPGEQTWPELVDLADAIQGAIEAQHNESPLTPEQEALLSRSSEESSTDTPGETVVSVDVTVEQEPRTCDPALGDQCEPFTTPEAEDHSWMDPIISEIDSTPGGPLPVGLEEPSGLTAVPDVMSPSGAGCPIFESDLITIDLCPIWGTARLILAWIVAIMTAVSMSGIWVDTMREPV